MRHIVLLFMLGITLSCTTSEQAPIVKNEKKIYTVTPVEKIPLRLTSIVEAQGTREYSFSLKGRISELKVTVGDTIVSGDTLAVLEQKTLAAEIALQKIVVNGAAADMERVKELYKKSVRTSVEKERAMQTYKEESGKLALLRSRYAEGVLKAIDSGVVQTISSIEGSYTKQGETVVSVSEGMPGVRLVNNSHYNENGTSFDWKITILGDSVYSVSNENSVVLPDGSLFLPLPEIITIGKRAVATSEILVKNGFSLPAEAVKDAPENGNILEIQTSDRTLFGEVVSVIAGKIYCIGDQSMSGNSTINSIFSVR